MIQHGIRDTFDIAKTYKVKGMRDSTGLYTVEKLKSLWVRLDLIYQWCPQCVQNSVE